MHLTMNDWIGAVGVAILLMAFVLNLLKKIRVNSPVYILLNIAGAGTACLASWLIHYMPFVILEGVWTGVSIFALISYLKKV